MARQQVSYRLSGLDPKRFLARTWQRRPMVIRGAFPGFVDPLTADELAGLATEADVRSRLVRERRGRKPWQVEHGPFTAERLSGLPAAGWSLLVSEVDHFVEGAARLLDAFNFIPHWRLDDLMVSFAPPGGSVGPHVDSYDVFLIQGQGRRRWRIARDFSRDLIAGADLRVLKNFAAEQEWVLEPGDLLYLPPGVAHHGIAIEPCLTYSVGFRAPAQRDLLLDLLALHPEVVAELAGEQLYADPGLTCQVDPAEITPEALARVHRLTMGALADPAVLGRWFGGVVTRSPQSPPLRRLRAAPKGEEFVAMLVGLPAIWRADQYRVAFWRSNIDDVFVYVGGEEHRLSAAQLPLVQRLTGPRCQPGRALIRALPRRGEARVAGIAWLRQLWRQGVISAGV